ncbi:MAG: PEP-CTERM sorting domain-containing protein, partial [Thauera sp.]
GHRAPSGATGGCLLNSGWFTAAYYTTLTLDFIRTTGANKLTKTVTLGLQPLLVEFDWTIDLLELRTSCDTGATCVPGGEKPLGFHFALDDLRIDKSTSTVPEPGMLALLGGGLLGMTLIRRRRGASAS